MASAEIAEARMSAKAAVPAEGAVSVEAGTRSADTTSIAVFLVGGLLIGGFWPMLTGLVSPTAGPIVGAIVLATSIAFVVLLAADIRGGNYFGATLSGVFGIMFGMVPGFVFMFQWILQAVGVQPDMRILGWYFVYIGVVLFIFGFAGGKMAWHLAIDFWAIGTVVVLMGLVFAGYLSASWNKPIGWVVFCAGLYMTYVGTASMLANTFQRPVLPLGRPLFK